MSLNRPIILYVDDDYFNITLFEFTFKNQFDIINVDSGYEALKLIKDNDKIEAVISDIRMPNMDGIELITKIKEIKPDIFCFLLTGYGGSPEVLDALEKKLIVDYFNKPFDKEKVIHILKSTLNTD